MLQYLRSTCAVICAMLFVALALLVTTQIVKLENANQSTRHARVTDDNLVGNRHLPCNLSHLLYLASRGAGKTYWSVDDTLSINATAASCDPGQFSVKLARRILQGQHIAFIGDSLTRYQYLSLAYFLETGMWQSPFPTNVNEREWRADQGENADPQGWTRFFNGTNARLNNNEICDCYRVVNGPWRRETAENRYYITQDGSVRVSFLLWFHQQGVRGHNLTGMNVNCLHNKQTAYRHRQAENSRSHSKESFVEPCAQGLCQPGTCKDPYHWEGDAFTIFPYVVKQLDPQIVVLNSGLWGFGVEKDICNTTSMLQEIRRHKPNVRLIWKTTTCKRGKRCHFVGKSDQEGVVRELLRSIPGLEVYDVRSLTSGVPKQGFWDHMHFTEPVYALLNAALLTQLALPVATQ